MIEGVEGFEAELDAAALSEHEVLEYGEVPVLITGSVKFIAVRIPNAARLRLRKDEWVDPLNQGASVGILVAGSIHGARADIIAQG